MQLKQKIMYMVLGGLLVFSWTVLPHIIVNNATAQVGKKETATIKYVFLVDYPLGKKAEYLEWVKSVAVALQAPEEIMRIKSYDNYYGVSPHRLVEFEFANQSNAMKYFEREEIKKIMEDLPNHASQAKVNVFMLRGDYMK